MQSNIDSKLPVYLYHLWCGGQLMPSKEEREGDEFCRCDLCGEGGYPFIDEWVDEEDLDWRVEIYLDLPTTFAHDGKRITVCSLIEGREGEHWLVELLKSSKRS
jgi:putative hemolysin